LTTDATPQQTKDDIHQLMQAIVRNLAVEGQPMPPAGLTRVEAALATVLSMRDQETDRLRTALNYARKGLARAEVIVSDDYERGNGSDLWSWDADRATDVLVTAQDNVAAALRGETSAT
jgi:hypothetical protein